MIQSSGMNFVNAIGASCASTPRSSTSFAPKLAKANSPSCSGARDEEHNEAVVLKELLTRNGSAGRP